jgi:hypothetical protein
MRWRRSPPPLRAAASVSSLGRFDRPLALYTENENKLARTPTVSVIYSPRYAL